MNNAGTLLLILLGIVGIIILCVIVPPLQTVNLCRIARLRTLRFTPLIFASKKIYG